jgi:poly-gamma-glutamate synthesis protein (capsule biosynthesis protein)
LNKHGFPVLAGLIIISILLSSCASKRSTTERPSTDVTATPQAAAQKFNIWLDPALPKELSLYVAGNSDFQEVPEKIASEIQISIMGENGSSNLGSFQRVYALEAPFPTITDEISLVVIKRIWLGNANEEDPFNTIQVSHETKAIFDELWGDSSSQNVQEVEASQFESNDFSQMKVWAIVPFEQISPRWKVIRVDGLSPLDKPLDANQYELTVNFGLDAKKINDPIKTASAALLDSIPSTNRDETKMTVLMMTGTTAIARAMPIKWRSKGWIIPSKQ